jgi:hypothetical protein
VVAVVVHHGLLLEAVQVEQVAAVEVLVVLVRHKPEQQTRVEAVVAAMKTAVQTEVKVLSFCAMRILSHRHQL